jgi:N-methylhydantoinase B
MPDVSPILLEIFKNRYASIAEEMGVTLNRTAFSPNIKERKDFSCALFDAKGEVIAQAAHIPVHLGSMPLSVKAAIHGFDFDDGDMVVLNDPFKGGTHLPDITLVAPVFMQSAQPVFFVANRAHHADVGGMSPGSMPLSLSIFQEGIMIPPLKLVKAGRMDEAIMAFILNNVRTPVEREGDFAAQMMANLTGIRRMQELIGTYDLQTVQAYARHLMDYSERITRQAIGAIPDGVYEYRDVMDDDGLGTEDIMLHVEITVEGEAVTIDFSQSAAQVAGSINAVQAITLSAVLYVFRSLITEDIPANAGIGRLLTVKTVKGSIVDAAFPAAVAGGNVETSQRIVDVLFGALAKALPERVPAASQGSMNNMAIGGVDTRSGQPFAYYETIAGGMGAAAGHHGASAMHSHMTNTLNTPVEALEYSYPFQVTEYAVRRGSGGKGQYHGGDGIIREIKLLCEAEITVLSERRRHSPYGLCGGAPGARGENGIWRNGRYAARPGKFYERLRPHDIIRIATPGGGGYGESSD